MGIVLAFQQAYQPVAGSILLSAIVAGVPLYVLFVMLAVLRLPAWICAITSMLTAAALGWLVWGMPIGITAGAATEGMAFGLWPISWIVLNAVFFHNLTVASGDFDVIRRSLTRLTEDRRLQTLLVAFSFGALLEGIAGFGAPVAITASILASMGFEPVTVAVLALLANTAPVAFGSIGIPITTLGGLVAPILGHTDALSTTRALSAMVGRQLPLFSILIPAYLIVVLAGWRRMREILPAVLLTGISFAIVQFAISNFVGPELTKLPTPTNLTADLKCGTVAFKLCPQPWFGPQPTKDRQAFKFPDWNFYWPGTYDVNAKGAPVSSVNREKPIVAKSTPYQNPFDWNFLAAAGSLVLYADIVAWLIMRIRRRRVSFFAVYARTLRQLALPITTIAFILAIAYVMNFSGMTSSLAIAFSKTGFVFPFVAAFLGWLGVFLTGSDTSSNTLFGPLQAQTAQQLGNVSPILTAGTNSSGGVMGKMISPQNLSVGAAGVNKVGAEGAIFARVIKYSLILTTLVGIVAMIEAYVLPGIVPSP